MLPIVHGLEDDYSGRIEFVRVNIHNPKNQALMDGYGFTTAPELYLVADGRIIGAWDDFVTEKELRQAFDSALNK